MTRSQGIAPTQLAEQVRSTAAWALDTDHAAARAVAGAAATEVRWTSDPFDLDYLRLLLAAHYLTVATFVPTDVDARIRHHYWQELDAERLGAACAVVDEAAAWDAGFVSARVVEATSGHDGEWLAVRAGALGRALVLRASEVAAQLAAQIDAELDREARAFRRVAADHERPLDALRLSTVIAHNVGDLSRVVEAWPQRPELADHRARYARLGHGDREGAAGDPWGGVFRHAGDVNKSVMAAENHRFLALRKARVLRGARDRLLPIGPFFDAWGQSIGAAKLDDEATASVLEALVETHLHGPGQLGCLRAIAGLHGVVAGGIDRLARDLPSRLRKVVAAGAVRDALKTSRAQHEARMANRWRSASNGVR